MRLVQIIDSEQNRGVALVEEPKLILLKKFTSAYELAIEAIENRGSLTSLVKENLSGLSLDYDSIYKRKSDWKLLPAFDHPTDLNGLMLSGTGLTHKASAENRQKMHQAETVSELTDSMKIDLS